jgi:hypothetical protein
MKLAQARTLPVPKVIRTLAAPPAAPFGDTQPPHPGLDRSHMTTLLDRTGIRAP